jgi:Transposase DDE domain
VAEDAEYGRGRRGTELPVELARRETRVAKIRAAKAVLEQQARTRAEKAAAAGRARLAAREQRVGSAKGGIPKVPDPEQAAPAPKAQYNFTDPDSRIMVDGATKSFVQAYNAQAAVDAAAQVIVACGVTQDAIDVRQLGPMLERLHAHLGRWPAVVTADAGYFNEATIPALEARGVEVYVPPDKQPHDAPLGTGSNRIRTVLAEAMRAKLRRPEARALYARRKAIVEPVFGQTKDARGFRRFSFRGYGKASAEWAVICLTHNLLKLFRAGWRACPA